MHPFRVAFTGAQGTGKSTLARALAQALRDAGCAGVTDYLGLGQSAALNGLALGERAGAPALHAIADLHLAREAAAEQRAGAEVQVFDRCLLDCLAYADVLGCLPAAQTAKLAQATQQAGRRLRLLVLMRITGDYPVLTPQDESPAFRRAIEQAIQRRAQQLDLRCLPLALAASEMDASARALAACLAPPGYQHSPPASANI